MKATILLLRRKESKGDEEGQNEGHMLRTNEELERICAALEAQVAETNKRNKSCVKSLKIANDEWSKTITQRDNWRKIAEGLANATKNDANLNLVISSMAQYASSIYNKTKAEEGAMTISQICTGGVIACVFINLILMIVMVCR